MGMQEMLLILTIIISIGQYLVAWGSYLEQKFTLVRYFVFVLQLFLQSI